MKRPFGFDSALREAKVVSSSSNMTISKNLITELEGFIDNLESKLQQRPECNGVTDDTEAVQAMLDKSHQRKKVSDAVDYFDGVWPDENRMTIFIYPWSDEFHLGDKVSSDTVCTREEFEAEVERRRGEEWTHRTNAGERCKIHVKEPDVNGVIIVMNERGEYLRHNSDSLKPIKPTISEDAKRQLELYVQYRVDKYGDYCMKSDLSDYLSYHDII